MPHRVAILVNPNREMRQDHLALYRVQLVNGTAQNGAYRFVEGVRIQSRSG
jgi:hypothetical protein